MKQNTLSKTKVTLPKPLTELNDDKIISARKIKLSNRKKLTEKEITVIKLICEEYSSSEIATKLKLSQRTVDSRREKILLKTKSKNVVGIVKYAVKNKIYLIK